MPLWNSRLQSGNELNLLRQSLLSFCSIVAVIILEYYETDFKYNLLFF